MLGTISYTKSKEPHSDSKDEASENTEMINAMKKMNDMQFWIG